MSGWDEGAVYYSDQAQFPESGTDGGVGGGGPSRHTVLRKFKEFIRNFEAEKNVFPYRESLVHNSRSLLVHLEDLLAFDAELPSFLRSSPADYLPLFETAAAEVLQGLRLKKMADDGEMKEPETGEVQILLSSKEDPVSMRALGAQYISKLVKISGITIAASRVKAKATYVSLVCKNCQSTKEVPCRPGLGGAIMPRSCDHVPQAGEEPCPLDPWIIVPDKSKYVDQQTLKLQENPEVMQWLYSPNDNNRGAVAVRQPYIRVVGMEETNEASSRGLASFTQEEEEEFRRFASRTDVYEAICSKVAPSIFGEENVKKAVACLLFGGSRKHLPDGVKLRGDINVLLLGDPSTAKSQFLKFVEKTAPIAVYTSGKGSSAAGLTASVIRDGNSREFYLEGGAMVLADGGVVCIDEFDKMRPEDRVSIHEAMEQQTISIAKAGITTVLNSRTSVLAAANPPSGRYDDLKTTQENIDLQTTILSRFDLIFIVKDRRDMKRDKTIASHIIKVHASADQTSMEHKPSKEDNWLKRYIQFCRTTCRPRLSETAANKLQNEYITFRQNMRRQANETGEAAAVPITVRQLEAIIRLSESLAKMKLSQIATEADVVEAVKLFKVSTIEAAQSGINQHVTCTPEIQQAETQIKRRMGIGSRLSERRLIDELSRMGMNESIVRRALIAMNQRDEIEYSRERRIIIRKM
ncbi:DNA replication licensing factor MCM5 [Linum perenne]